MKMLSLVFGGIILTLVANAHQFGNLIDVDAPSQALRGEPMMVKVTVENADDSFSDGWFFSYHLVITKWPVVTLERATWGQLGEPSQRGRYYDSNPQVFTFIIDPDHLPNHAGEYSFQVHARIRVRQEWGFGGWPSDSTTSDSEADDSPRTVHFKMVGDFTKPYLRVLSPAPGEVPQSSTLVLSGEVSDDIGLASLDYQLGTNTFRSIEVNGNRWSTTVELQPGLNTLQIRARDLSGNEKVITRLVKYLVLSPLRLQINGSGAISPFHDGQNLEVGRQYSIRAVPGRGNLFSGWTGALESNDATLNFTMASNLWLAAKFVPNPFLALKGSYIGLFYDTNAPAHENAGCFRLQVTDKGGFSGTIQQGAAKYSLSGKFDLSLSAQSAARFNGGSLPVALRLTGGSEILSGTVSNWNWSSALFGYRTTFDNQIYPVSPYKGSYTIVFPGATNAAEGPFGHGFASIKVKDTGNLTLTGALSDGSAAAMKAYIGSTGIWPLYASLYSGNGSIFGWLGFTNDESLVITGSLLWTKPAAAHTAICSQGFTNYIPTAASRFNPPTLGSPVLDCVTAVLVMDGGDLPVAMAENLAFDLPDKIKVTSENPNNLSLSLSTADGTFRGTFRHPQIGKPTRIKGAVLQNQGVGCGFFLGYGQSGKVYFCDQARRLIEIGD
jgi:Divergent InlB B-repeat domain